MVGTAPGRCDNRRWVGGKAGHDHLEADGLGKCVKCTGFDQEQRGEGQAGSLRGEQFVYLTRQHEFYCPT